MRMLHDSMRQATPESDPIGVYVASDYPTTLCWQEPSILGITYNRYEGWPVSDLDSAVRIKLLEVAAQCRELAAELLEHADRLERRAVDEVVIAEIDEPNETVTEQIQAKVFDSVEDALKANNPPSKSILPNPLPAQETMGSIKPRREQRTMQVISEGVDIGKTASFPGVENGSTNDDREERKRRRPKGPYLTWTQDRDAALGNVANSLDDENATAELIATILSGHDAFDDINPDSLTPEKVAARVRTLRGLGIQVRKLKRAPRGSKQQRASSREQAAGSMLKRLKD